MTRERVALGAWHVPIIAISLSRIELLSGRLQRLEIGAAGVLIALQRQRRLPLNPPCCERALAAQLGSFPVQDGQAIPVSGRERVASLHSLRVSETVAHP